MAGGELHEQLIQGLCTQGWQTGNWRPALRKAAQANAFWKSEIADRETIEVLKLSTEHPDAWRFVTEGEDTGRWSYDVLVIEFMEVEISHPVSAEKAQGYIDLCRLLDGTAFFHFRAFRMDKYGVIRPIVTEETMWA